MATTDYIKSLHIEDNVFELIEDTVISYLVHYYAPFTGSSKINVPAGTTFVAYGPMNDYEMYIHLSEENDDLRNCMDEQEKKNNMKLADRLHSYSFFISEDEVRTLNLRFIKGSKDRLLEIYRLLRSEPVIQRNNFTKDSTFMPKLLGLLCFYNSTPLKGTKYIESLSSDKKYKLSDLLPQSDPEFAPSTIKEIAEDCKWLFLRDLLKDNRETFDEIKSCYTQAVNDGIYEAANNLGVLAYCYENDSDEANRLFNYAASRGSQNAMLNQFNILWNGEQYLEGVAMLENMFNKDIPSLKCLYNLAYLYYMGNDCHGNHLKKNIRKAKEILKMIIEYDQSIICENETSIPSLAEKFLAFIDSENIYAMKAKEFHNIILASVSKTNLIKDKGEVFRYLTSIHLHNGYKLGLRLAEQRDMGDNSNFFVYDNQDNVDEDLIKFIITDQSAMGAWQIYLLMTAFTIMPCYWHGQYNERKYIYNKRDVQEIKVFERLDIRGLLAKDFLLPKVTIVKVSEESQNISTTDHFVPQASYGKYEADVYCCYWNDWVGLVREHVRITLNNSKIEKYEVVGRFVIYPYHCGIYL